MDEGGKRRIIVVGRKKGKIEGRNDVGRRKEGIVISYYLGSLD